MTDSTKEIEAKLCIIKARMEEECRLNLVKTIIDSACTVIQSRFFSPEKQDSYRIWIKQKTMPFIPGDEEKYDMIYDSRLKRYIQQFGSSS